MTKTHKTFDPVAPAPSADDAGSVRKVVEEWLRRACVRGDTLSDRTHVITGSFNLTTSAATRNAENVVLIPDDPEVAEAFAGNFFKRAKGARTLQERPPRDADVSMSGAPTGATASP